MPPESRSASSYFCIQHEVYRIQNAYIYSIPFQTRICTICTCPYGKSGRPLLARPPSCISNFTEQLPLLHLGTLRERHAFSLAQQNDVFSSHSMVHNLIIHGQQTKGHGSWENFKCNPHWLCNNQPKHYLPAVLLESRHSTNSSRSELGISLKILLWITQQGGILAC